METHGVMYLSDINEDTGKGVLLYLSKDMAEILNGLKKLINNPIPSNKQEITTQYNNIITSIYPFVPKSEIDVDDYKEGDMFIIRDDNKGLIKLLDIA